MANKISLTWEDIEKDVTALSKELRKSHNFSKIVCEAKGGLILSYFLAKALGIKYIETVCMSHYDGEDRKDEVSIIPRSKVPDVRKNWLIVDDLVDTGKTAELAKKYYPNSKLAVLYKKPTSVVTPDFYVKEVEGWVVFPWEKVVLDSYKLKHMYDSE